MDDKAIEVMIDNEREWRRMMYSDLQKVKKDVHILKFKVVGTASVLGSAFGVFGQQIVAYLLKGMGK